MRLLVKTSLPDDILTEKPVIRLFYCYILYYCWRDSVLVQTQRKLEELKIREAETKQENEELQKVNF